MMTAGETTDMPRAPRRQSRGKRSRVHGNRMTRSDTFLNGHEHDRHVCEYTLIRQYIMTTFLLLHQPLVIYLFI